MNIFRDRQSGVRLKRTVLFLASVFLYLIFAPREGIVGRVYPNDISLAELVQHSDIIVIASPIQPIRTPQRRAIEGKQPSGKPAPPFLYSTYLFTVSEVLAGENAIERDGTPLGLRSGQTITVRDADFHMNLDLHTAYEVHGETRSYKKDVFPTNIDLEKAVEPILLLLTYDQKDRTYEFRCMGAWVPAGMKTEVRRLLRELPR